MGEIIFFALLIIVIIIIMIPSNKSYKKYKAQCDHEDSVSDYLDYKVYTLLFATECYSRQLEYENLILQSKLELDESIKASILYDASIKQGALNDFKDKIDLYINLMNKDVYALYDSQDLFESDINQFLKNETESILDKDVKGK